MTNRPDLDEFSANVMKAMRATRRQAPAADDTSDQLRDDTEQAMTVDQVIANATRPWKRFTFWLLVGCVLLGTLSVVQWAVTR